MMKIYKYISQSVVTIGWLNTLVLILNRLLVRISNGKIRIYKYELVAQPVSNKPYLASSRGKKIVIRQIDVQDPVVQLFPRPISVIRDRFRNGAICLVAFKDDEFAGFIWLMLGPYQEDEVRARYTPLPIKHAAWDFDVYVNPHYRLGFTFLRLWDEANLLLNKNGVEWSCSRISSFNQKSSKSHAGLGAVILGQATFIVLADWQVTLASISPYIDISLKPGSFPEFFLETSHLNNAFSMKDDRTIPD